MIPIFSIISNNKIKGRGHRGKDALRPTVGTLRSVARRNAPYRVP